jgi:hypothetical protein
MKKAIILGLSCTLLSVMGAEDVAAQYYGVAPRFGTIAGDAVTPTNFHKDYLKRFMITEPANIAGSKVYTIANNGRGSAGEWGRAIDSTWINVTLVKTNPGDACAVLSNAAAINGNWAFIWRGDCEFGAKALKAQQAGAKGVIIANHLSGGPVGMGAGAQGAQVNIPVLMISKEDGEAIDAAFAGSNTVKLSLSPWSLGHTHDLGILPSGGVLWHAYAIPRYQVESSNGNPGAYQHHTGAFIGNFGTATETNVKIKNVISFTPNGGSATVLKEDSIEIPTFAPLDSIMYGFTDDRIDFHATGNGRLDAVYTVTMDNTDESEGDNELVISSYVNDSIYSRARYDFTAGRPISTSAYGLSSGNAFLWGPLYYMARGGRAIWDLQFSVSNGSQSSPALDGESDLNLYIFEWNDADNDSAMVGSELNLVGIATKQFVSGDSSGKFFSAVAANADDTRLPFITKSNTWYWVAADMPAGWFLGVDGYLNYYPRHVFGAAQANSFRDPYGPLYAGNVSALVGSTDFVGLLPFEPYVRGDSARFSQQSNGLVPSIALRMSKEDKTGVGPVREAVFQDISLYPNPATDLLHVRVSMVNPSEKVRLTVLDAMGRNIMMVERNNVQQEVIEVPTSSLASGNYYLVINSDGGATVRKFTVNREQR